MLRGWTGSHRIRKRHNEKPTHERTAVPRTPGNAAPRVPFTPLVMPLTCAVAVGPRLGVLGRPDVVALATRRGRPRGAISISPHRQWQEHPDLWVAKHGEFSQVIERNGDPVIQRIEAAAGAGQQFAPGAAIPVG